MSGADSGGEEGGLCTSVMDCGMCDDVSVCGVLGADGFGKSAFPPTKSSKLSPSPSENDVIGAGSGGIDGSGACASAVADAGGFERGAGEAVLESLSGKWAIQLCCTCADTIGSVISKTIVEKRICTGETKA